MIALFLTLGCGESGPEFVPVSDWRGTAPDVLLASKPRHTVESARAAARARGVEASEAGPDVSGMWITIDEGEETIAEVRVLRQQPEPGVYNTVDTMYLYKRFKPVAQIEFTGIEVFSDKASCFYVIKSRISYLNDDVKTIARPGLEELYAPDRRNENPCTDIGMITKDQIDYRTVDGPFVESRRPSPRREK